LALAAALAIPGIYGVIRCVTLRCAAVYGAGLLLVLAVFALERVMERLLPQGRRRHRLLGRVTMVVFLIVLVTATLTYLSLYVFYPPRPS
jgi:uncharacterized membrane protein YozB (DUF420 family)